MTRMENISARADLSTDQSDEIHDERQTLGHMPDRDSNTERDAARREQQARDYWSAAYGKDAEISSRGVLRF